MWEPVHEYVNGRRKVVYWRLPGGPRKWAGAYARRSRSRWEAIGYPLDGRDPGPHVNKALGVFPTWRQARRAVEQYRDDSQTAE